MHAVETDGVCAIEAYRSACGTQPVLARQVRPEFGVSLYRWDLTHKSVI